MQIEISTETGYLEEEWWALWRRDPDATPFQSPAWLLPWRRHFDQGRNVVLTVRKGGRLVLLLPLFRLEGRLLLWGAGTSDWLGGLSDPTLEPDDFRGALARLDAPLDLFQLAERCLLMRCRAPDGWEERCGFSQSCAVLSLPAEPGAKMRQNLRYYRRRAERAGVGEPELLGAEHTTTLADLHARRWHEREEPGVFADPRFLAWQEEAATLLESAGILRLYGLRLAGAVIAALYVLAAKGKAFYYISGFDPAHAHIGPGTLLVGHAIAEAERAGMTSFDFLRGQEAYKYRWGAIDRPTWARYLAPRSTGGVG